MARLVPIVLLTAFAAYVVWDDVTSEEPISTLAWAVDAAIVGLAAWSWASFLKPKREEH